MEEVSASLCIEMNLTCPNDECGAYINILNEKETNNYDHDEDGHLLRQMFPKHGSHDDFECEEVTCGECQTTFNVKGLEW